MPSLKLIDMVFLYLFFGFLFGYFLIQARLNRYDTISGMATLEDYTVAKAIMVALGVGTILVSMEIALGSASFHVKPFIPGSLILGGLIFGAGMAILGYCPGTLVVSLGEGSLDALAGIAGGIVGGVAYYYAAPLLKPIMGSDLGKLSLHSVVGSFNLLYFLLVFVLSALLIWGAFILHRLEKGANLKWLYSGAGLAVLNGLMFMTLTIDKPMAASSFFPWAGGHILGLTGTGWFEKLSTSGDWLLFFLGGALLAGFLFSVIRKEFKWRVIHDRWARYKGNSVAIRLVFAFAGGFLLLFGARMAGGCTSGHVISGGMQVAFSSYLFALFTFAGLLITGYIFYRKG
jgi:uncharacterized protein